MYSEEVLNSLSNSEGMLWLNSLFPTNSNRVPCWVLVRGMDMVVMTAKVWGL